MFKTMLSFREKWKWSRRADRLGPDMISTHYMLQIPYLQQKICEEKFAEYGKQADFRAGAYAIGCSNIYLGEKVVIRPQSMLFANSYAAIVIEEKVLIGSGVQIYVHNHRFDDKTIPIYDQGAGKCEPVLIKKGAWIGANAIILPGVTIEENAVIAAGAVVTKNIAQGEVVGGIPAKKLY